MLNKIPAQNRVALAFGVWAAPCNNDKVIRCLLVMKAFAHKRDRGKRTSGLRAWGVVWCIEEIYCIYHV